MTTLNNIQTMTRADIETALGTSHPAVLAVVRHFANAHLPARLRDISGMCLSLALGMALSLPDGPEKTTGLRKLLEAKDCFVRAELDREK